MMIQKKPNKSPEDGSNKLFRNFALWLAVIAGLAFAWNAVYDGGALGRKRMTFSEFLAANDATTIQSVKIIGNEITGKISDKGDFATTIPTGYTKIIDELRAKNVQIEASDSSTSGVWLSMLFAFGPVVLLVGLWLFVFKQMGSGGKVATFGRSRAKMMGEKTKVLFSDVAGIEEAKEELSEVVDFLKNPLKFSKLGGKIPRGCLLVGPPGTGKTMLARAIAGEAGVPFFSISGSDFVEMFVGVGASRVRDMFLQGKKSAPCIIFIDEIDAVGRHRGLGLGGGNDEREQTLNQLLVEMDGFEDNEGVIIVAATNRPDVLDPALLRPGRFDRQIMVSNPDIKGREAILVVHARKITLSPDAKLDVIARGTPGFSGADLANLINESALLAARKEHKAVTMNDLEQAKDKVMMGPERKSMIMTEDEKRLTAFHEGGHAIVAINMPASDKIHKATIMPRGRALGMVMRLPDRDQFSMSRAKMHADLAVMMGGRVAEEMVFGYDQVTSGASSDISHATELARNMVTKWGLSDVIGTVYHDDGSERGQYALAGHKSSEDSARAIDSEIRRIIDEAYKKARAILEEKRADLDLLAAALLERETLSGDEITALLVGGCINPTQQEILSETQSFMPDVL